MSVAFYTNFFQYGKNCIVFGVDENGKRVKIERQIKPKLYVKSDTPSVFKTFRGDNLKEFTFESTKDANDFIKNYKNSDFEVFGFPRFKYSEINSIYPYSLKELEYNPKVLYIDIETTVENGFPEWSNPVEEITLITVICGTKGITYGTLDVDNQDGYNFKYIRVKDEFELLHKVCNIFSIYRPDIITGWNVDGFDLPYFIRRCQKLSIKKYKELSPVGVVREEVGKDDYGNDALKISILGLSILDYIQLYKKFKSKTETEYKLDYIAEKILKKKKVSYDGTFEEFYKNDPTLFVKYNQVDVVLVKELNDELKLIDLAVGLAYLAKVNYEDVISPLLLWDVIIDNHLKSIGMLVPSDSHSDKSEKYDGAIVKETIAGFYRWMCSFDLESLYPSIMIQYNISPDTFHSYHPLTVEDFINKTQKYLDAFAYAKEHNLTLCVNGAMFRKDVVGFVPLLVRQMFDERKATKNEMKVLKSKLNSGSLTKEEKIELKSKIASLDVKQLALKIAANSLYGILGTQYFRFFDVNLATAITLTGQYIITVAQDGLNNKMNLLCDTGSDYIVASDTDSSMMDCSFYVDNILKSSSDSEVDIVNKLDNFCKEIVEPLLKNVFKNVFDDTLGMENRLYMKREKIAKGIFVAKKNYVNIVYDNEGVRYETPELSVTGLESVKGTTPRWARKMLEDGYEKCFTATQEDIYSYIESMRMEMKKLPLASIASSTSVSDIVKWKSGKDSWLKGAPYHVKGSLVYNRMIVEYGLEKKYPLIRNGDKIKYVLLKKENPIESKYFFFKDKLPEEFQIDDFIDRDFLFQKFFITPFKRVLDVMKFNSERVYTFDF